MDQRNGVLWAIAAAGLVAAGAGCTASAVPPPAERPQAAAEIGRAVPRLVDLGSTGCVPCKAMAPILEELKAEYAGRLEVEFIDVWKDPDAAKPYGIRLIPTQIFQAADGRELARHQGFMAKDEILAQWRAAGVKL